jgi:adenylate cyclase
MYIIFGDTAAAIPNGHTVLELDTVRRPPDNIPVTAYCVIDKLPLQEFPIAEGNKKLHSELMQHYRACEWDQCGQAIQVLLGKWNGELDSFYVNLDRRVEQYRSNPPPADWDGTYTVTTNK